MNRGYHRTIAAATGALLAGVVASACGSAPEPIDRTVPPVLGPPAALTLPPVVSRELPNGLKVLMVEHHELPIVNFIMLVGAGPELDPTDKGGLATLAAALLDEGTTTRTSLEIADQAAFLGATLSTVSGWDNSRVALQTVTSELDSALALFADVVLNPAFPQNELDRLRSERLTSILQSRDNPQQIAEVEFARVVFGAQHPYGRDQMGTESSVKAITRTDVEGFHRSYYRPNNSTLIVVGDMDPAEMERKVNALFANWERGEVARVEFPTAPQHDGTMVHLIHKPGTPQTSVRLGHVSVPRSTPDYFPLIVVNTVLGGSFTSRLNMNLRETKGYTYGANSRFEMRKHPGPFVARAEIIAASTDSALVEFLKELNSIRDTIPAEELEKAKQYMQLQLPNAFEATADIAAQLVPVALYGLPLDYYNSYTQSVGAVSQSDAARVSNIHINPNDLIVIMVGDKGVVEPLLRQMGIRYQVRNVMVE